MIHKTIQGLSVSIHAPTRGATWSLGIPSIHAFCFNPRSHEGSDGAGDVQQLATYQFQSTLPRGERPCGTPEDVTSDRVSIHAPTRGATRGRKEKYMNYTGFNPRSHEGSDKVGLKLPDNTIVSIHAPTRGATNMGVERHTAEIKFQSTLPRGERLHDNVPIPAY